MKSPVNLKRGGIALPLILTATLAAGCNPEATSNTAAHEAKPVGITPAAEPNYNQAAGERNRRRHIENIRCVGATATWHDGVVDVQVDIVPQDTEGVWLEVGLFGFGKPIQGYTEGDSATISDPNHRTDGYGRATIIAHAPLGLKSAAATECPSVGIDQK